MNRLNGARTTRHYLQITLPSYVVDWGWYALREVVVRARREGVDPARLEWRRYTDSPIGITALFEVV